MQKKESGFQASLKKYRNPAIAWLLPFMLTSPSHALVDGSVGTIYNGPLPSDLRLVCRESAPNCSVTGLKEVWYGYQNSWVYKLVNGAFSCTNEYFSDPAYSRTKACYSRDITTPAALPPAMDKILLEFNLNDLLTVQNKRYTFTVMDGTTRISPTIDHVAIYAHAIPSPQRLQQNYFQFDITDGASPIRQHSIFVSPTFDRCLISRQSKDSLISVYGRIMEIYSLTSMPTSQTVPQRSDVQKVCTNDKGYLQFNLKPPSSDAFQIKIVNYDDSSKANDVFDFFVPINFDWMKK